MNQKRGAQRGIVQSVQSATLADLLERILDKGIVIAGDIRIQLVQVELLTIQLRLVICSVDKAKEMGMDWWVNHPAFDRHARPEPDGQRLVELEARLAAVEEQRLAEMAELKERLTAVKAAVGTA
ncbi:MAG: gas vesicle protein [Planctomycetes bacterium]|nr:gas vesicle protein [Acidobacteriota bacterium]MBI3465557.1 gas vesicle protein [Planctomycetota bacterium]